MGSVMGAPGAVACHADGLPQVHRASAASLRAETGTMDVDAMLMQSSRSLKVSTFHTLEIQRRCLVQRYGSTLNCKSELESGLNPVTITTLPEQPPSAKYYPGVLSTR